MRLLAEAEWARPRKTWRPVQVSRAALYGQRDLEEEKKKQSGGSRHFLCDRI